MPLIIDDLLYKTVIKRNIFKIQFKEVIDPETSFKWSDSVARTRLDNFLISFFEMHRLEHTQINSFDEKNKTVFELG